MMMTLRGVRNGPWMRCFSAGITRRRYQSCCSGVCTTNKGGLVTPTTQWRKKPKSGSFNATAAGVNNNAQTSWFSTQPQPQQQPSGAWTLLAALEKAREAHGVRVAKLVSSLEALIPRTAAEDSVDSNRTSASDASPLHTRSTTTEHTLDPAFFALTKLQTAAASSSLSTTDIGEGYYQFLDLTRSDILELLKATRQGRRLALSTIETLIDAATELFASHVPSTVITIPRLEPNQSVTVVGDLHGSLSDLETVLMLTGEPSPDHVLLFNGDLADRGEHGIEVIAIVCALALAYPHQVYVNRGNHEDLALSVAYGLALEIQYKYGSKAFSKRLGPLLDRFFQSLPLATVMEGDALIVHGGPPPVGVSLNDLMTLDVPEIGDTHNFSRTVRQTCSLQEHKHNKPDAYEILETMVWSDPRINQKTNTLNDYHDPQKGWKPNQSRGAGLKFDASIVRDLLEREGLVRLIRSHEPVPNGCSRYTILSEDRQNQQQQAYEFFTVFSASRYPNKEGFNKGAVITLLPDHKHHVIRYDTEDDYPTLMEKSSIVETDLQSEEYECTVDTMSIRRVLSEAIASHRSDLEVALTAKARHLNVEVERLPFYDAVDVLIDVLQLEDEGLCEPSSCLALAQALSSTPQTTICADPTMKLPDTIDLLHAIDECLLAEELDGNTNYYSIHLNWLHAIFALVDVNHDGVISKAEWRAAVAKMNANLPKGSGPIDAEATWQLFDLDHNGSISVEEWDTLLLNVSLTNR